MLHRNIYTNIEKHLVLIVLSYCHRWYDRPERIYQVSDMRPEKYHPPKKEKKKKTEKQNQLSKKEKEKKDNHCSLTRNDLARKFKYNHPREIYVP